MDGGGGEKDWFKQIRSLFQGGKKYTILPYQLKQLGPNLPGNTFPLTGRQTGNEQLSCIVGRATQGGVQPDVNIPDPTISRQHIEIVIIGGQLGVRHLYSENRTSINGNLLEAGLIYQLAAGDKLVLGKVEFELEGR
jgi:pSer/pThr/pTyr-binding forkhead associated (FHA) protein